MGTDGLEESIEKMRADGVPDLAIRTFSHYYEKLAAGEQGTIAESDIEPVGELPDLADLPDGDPAHLDQAIVVKLNGGLGTSMGMTAAKSLLEVKDGLSFLDVIARQVLALRREYGCELPLLLMDSFSTREDSLEALSEYAELDVGLPLDFIQNKEPK